jgi:hypothetical protein
MRSLQSVNGNPENTPRAMPLISQKPDLGLSSCTLQIHNIVPLNENCTIPNVRKNYTVTDRC